MPTCFWYNQDTMVNPDRCSRWAGDALRRITATWSLLLVAWVELGNGRPEQDSVLAYLVSVCAKDLFRIVAILWCGEADSVRIEVEFQ